MINLNLFLNFFQFNFRFQARDLRLILQQILDHIDTLFDIQNIRTPLTIYIYLNRPPYNLQLDLGIREKHQKILYHFLPVILYDLFRFFQYAFILMHVILTM